MKRNILFIILTSLVFIGCSKDDNYETKKDPMIGIWHEWSDSGEEYSDCQKKTTIEFTADGEVYSKRFELDSNNQCTTTTTTTTKEKEGYWKFKEKNVYIFTINSREITVYTEFSNNNRTLKIRRNKKDIKNYNEYRKL